MKHMFAFIMFISFSVVLFANDSVNYMVIDINNIGNDALETMKQDTDIEWWVELDSEMLVLVKQETISALQEKYHCRVLPTVVNTNNLYFVQRAHQKDLMIPGLEVLGSAGRTAVVQAQESCVLNFGQSHDCYYDGNIIASDARHVHASLAPFEPNTVLARQVANEKPTIRNLGFTAGQFASLADEVDKNRWMATVDKLSTYNRYTHGDQILNARDWLASEYEKLGLSVSTVSFNVGSTKAYNVVAVLEGTERPDEWYIVGGHYDSISESPRTAAPGGEDNGSGASGVLEMARVFAKHRPKATIIFVNYSGEEQGLHGSYKHVADLFANGDREKVQFALIMDMIGYTGDADLDLLLETGSAFKHVFPVFTEAAQNYTTLRTLTSLKPFGSDHVPFINKNIPSLLTIENDWDEYAPYHTTGDRSSKVSLDMGHQVLRMNVVTLAMMMEK